MGKIRKSSIFAQISHVIPFLFELFGYNTDFFRDRKKFLFEKIELFMKKIIDWFFAENRRFLLKNRKIIFFIKSSIFLKKNFFLTRKKSVLCPKSSNKNGITCKIWAKIADFRIFPNFYRKSGAVVSPFIPMKKTFSS